MNFTTGKFHDYTKHHRAWFTTYRGAHTFEMWFGNRWFLLDW